MSAPKMRCVLLGALVLGAPLSRAEHEVAPFNCSEGYKTRHLGWSQMKKAWCCTKLGQACEEEVFHCTADYETRHIDWSATKLDWCCTTTGVGCKGEPTGLLFNCNEGYNNWRKGWSVTKMEWCCEHEERGCQPKTDPFDCSKGREENWTKEHQKWCKENYGVRLVTKTTAKTSAPTTATPTTAAATTSAATAKDGEGSSGAAGRHGGLGGAAGSGHQELGTLRTDKQHSQAVGGGGGTGSGSGGASGGGKVGSSGMGGAGGMASGMAGGMAGKAGGMGGRAGTASTSGKAGGAGTAGIGGAAGAGGEAGGEGMAGVGGATGASGEAGSAGIAGAGGIAGASSNQTSSTIAPRIWDMSIGSDNSADAAGDAWDPLLAGSMPETGVGISVAKAMGEDFNRAPPLTAAQLLDGELHGVNMSNSAQRQTMDRLSLQDIRLCSEEDVAWEPLDMKGKVATREFSLAQCQARCAWTAECAHFSFEIGDGYCHLQSVFATRQTNRLGYVSGPPSCNEVDGSRRTLTILAKANGCYTKKVAYMPLDMEGTFPTEAKDIIHCQERCAHHTECAHFTYDVLTTLCHLADNNSQPVENMIYSMAGPPMCKGRVQFGMDLDNVAFEQLSNSTVRKECEDAIQKAIAAEVGHDVDGKEIHVLMSEGNPAGTIMRKLFPKTEEPHVTKVKVMFYPPKGMKVDGVETSLKSFRSMQYSIAESLGNVENTKQVAHGTIKVGQVSGVALVVPAEAKFQSGKNVVGSKWQPTMVPIMFVAAASLAVMGVLGHLAFRRLPRSQHERLSTVRELLREDPLRDNVLFERERLCLA